MSVLEIVARTLWGEARGEGEAGMVAVACVIMNRAHNPRWWGHDPAEVCTKPAQFSCWNESDPNRAKLLAVTKADPQFAQAISIASNALCCLLADVTFNADSYFAIGSPLPYWVAGLDATVTIAGQSFYRVELPPPATSAALRTPGVVPA